MKKLITLLVLGLFAQMSMGQTISLNMDGDDIFVLKQINDDRELMRGKQSDILLHPNEQKGEVTVERKLGNGFERLTYPYDEFADGDNGNAPFSSVLDVVAWGNGRIAKTRGDAGAGAGITAITSADGTVAVLNDGAGNIDLSADKYFKGIVPAGNYDFTAFPAPTTGNAYIDSAPTDIKAGTTFIATGDGSFTLDPNANPFLVYEFTEGDLITVVEDAANFANAKLNVNENKSGSTATDLKIFLDDWTISNVEEPKQLIVDGQQVVRLEDASNGWGYYNIFGNVPTTTEQYTRIKLARQVGATNNFMLRVGLPSNVHDLQINLDDGSAFLNTINSVAPAEIVSSYVDEHSIEIITKWQPQSNYESWTLQPTSGSNIEQGYGDLIELDLNYDTAFGINSNNGAGFGITNVPLDDDAAGIANPVSIGANTSYTSTGDRVTATTTSKEYDDITLVKGKYRIGVFSGGNNTVESHRLDITLSGFNNKQDNQPLLGDHIRQVFDWTPNAANVRNGYFKITDDKDSSVHLEQPSIVDGTTKEFYVFGQSYAGDTQTTQDLQIGLNILVTALDGKISFELGGESKFLNPATPDTFADLKYNDLVTNGGPAYMKESQFNFFFRDLKIQTTGFPSLSSIDVRRLEINNDLSIGDTYYNTDRNWLQTYVGNSTNDESIWPWKRLGLSEVPNKPTFYGDVTQANAAGPQYINVGKYTFTESGTYTIKHNVTTNTGTNAFSITTSLPTQANPTVDVVYTSEANRVVAPSSEETYTDVVLEAGVEYYFSVWSGGGSTSFDHLLEVIDYVSADSSTSDLYKLLNQWTKSSNAGAAVSIVEGFDVRGSYVDIIGNTGNWGFLLQNDYLPINQGMNVEIVWDIMPTATSTSAFRIAGTGVRDVVFNNVDGTLTRTDAGIITTNTILDEFTSKTTIAIDAWSAATSMCIYGDYGVNGGTASNGGVTGFFRVRKISFY